MFRSHCLILTHRFSFLHETTLLPLIHCFSFREMFVCLFFFSKTLVHYVVLDTECFERLLGPCTKLLKRAISEYRYLDDDLRSYFTELNGLEELHL